MKFKPFPQNKLKTSPKLYYSTNFLKQQNSPNTFGGLKKNRDITPFRKYKPLKKKKTTNNISKNNKAQIKNLKIEGDLMAASSYGMKRSKTPINQKVKNNTSTTKSPILKSNLNSLSTNQSIKLNSQNNKFLSNNKRIKIGKSTNPFYSPLNRSTRMNYNRSATPNNKINLMKNKIYNNSGQAFKHNRSITPFPKSRITLNKNNSKISFGNSNIKNKKIPFLGLKNRNFLSTNSLSNKMNKNHLNMHYNNFFKSKNIFAGIKKNKPKVITINMNINQNFLSTSSKNNIDNSHNKNTPRTIQDNNINNNLISINNNNNHSHSNLIIDNNSASSNSFSIINKYNDKSLAESNNSIAINGIQKNSSASDLMNKNDINSNEPIQIRKKILCMHEFSKTGYAGEDEKKINQDNYFVFRNFMNNVNYIFMAVCDGHGAVGQEISNFLKENLPIDLNHALRNKNKNILTDDISDIITDIFIKENTKLISNEMINSMLSGSTCVSTIYTPIKLITANVGDSRIILGKYNQESNKWVSVDLTRDHKPSLPDEEKRIISKGGRIEPMKDEDNSFIGPPRVWLKEQDYPGLAMSRSFGDRVAHSVGVSEEPEIKDYFFCKEDKFFVVASDGLFEFISSQNIVEIIKDYYLSGDIVGCCEYLYELSKDKWMKEEEVVDDITMILVFLEDE
jgi:serine/threonine protein phosphatase PrpC